MVHNLPENFNISDFDVFHSALLYIGFPHLDFGTSNNIIPLWQILVVSIFFPGSRKHIDGQQVEPAIATSIGCGTCKSSQNTIAIIIIVKAA